MTLELLHVIRDYNIHLQGHHYFVKAHFSVDDDDGGSCGGEFGNDDDICSIYDTCSRISI